MEKFLSIPVTDEQAQLVSCTDVKLVEQASTTTVTLAYGGGKVVTITYTPATSAGDESLRDLVQSSLAEALATAWYDVVYEVAWPTANAVSGIAIS